MQRLDDEVLRFPDDLSCGPIGSDDTLSRAAWWSQFVDEFYEEATWNHALRTFWDRATGSESRLVVWFGRHAASEVAFFLAWADRLGERPYDIVDVTSHRLRREDNSRGFIPQAVGIIPSALLQSLFGSERRIAAEERETSRQHWRRLKTENAPFRIITDTGLASAPIDHFDSHLLQHASTEWKRVARIVGDTMTMGQNYEPYMQVGDLMPHTRVVALVEAGKLLAEGDPWDMRGCRVRLPDP